MQMNSSGDLEKIPQNSWSIKLLPNEDESISLGFFYTDFENNLHEIELWEAIQSLTKMNLFESLKMSVNPILSKSQGNF